MQAIFITVLYDMASNVYVPLFLPGQNFFGKASCLEQLDNHCAKDTAVVHDKVIVSPILSNAPGMTLVPAFRTHYYDEYDSWYHERSWVTSGDCVIYSEHGYYMDADNPHAEPGKEIKQELTLKLVNDNNKFYYQEWDGPKLVYETIAYPKQSEVILRDPSEALRRFREVVLPSNVDPDRHLGLSESFRSAARQIMPMQVNNIANLIQLKEGLSSAVHLFKSIANIDKEILNRYGKKALDALKRNNREKFRKLTQCSSDAWLAYRYSYTTTKMDIQAAYDNIDQSILAFDSLNGYYYPPQYSSYSSQSCDYHFKLKVQPKISNEVQRVWLESAIYGLQPNLVNLWDMIPFSFIIDWFLPVEDICSVIDDSINFSTTHFLYEELEYSEKQRIPFSYCGAYCLGTHYHRDFLDCPPELTIDWDNSPSDKTVTMRTADAASLIISSKGGL